MKEITIIVSYNKYSEKENYYYKRGYSRIAAKWLIDNINYFDKPESLIVCTFEKRHRALTKKTNEIDWPSVISQNI